VKKYEKRKWKKKENVEEKKRKYIGEMRGARVH
jgi:hypothetical protein